MKRLLLVFLLVGCKKETVQPDPEPTPTPVIDYATIQINNPIYSLELLLMNDLSKVDSVYTQKESDGTPYKRATKMKYAIVRMAHYNGGKMTYTILVNNKEVKSYNGTVGSKADTLTLK